MRVYMRLGDKKYATKISGALVGWDNQTEQMSFITLYGKFPVNNTMVEEYTIHFRTEIGFSLCKKLEKEGTADLSTDYIRGFIISEDVVDYDE